MALLAAAGHPPERLLHYRGGTHEWVRPRTAGGGEDRGAAGPRRDVDARFTGPHTATPLHRAATAARTSKRSMRCRSPSALDKSFHELSAFSATSRQPLSIVRECPRFGILTISVTPVLCRCLLNAAFAIAHGTVWSFSPSRISSGPRSGFFVSTFASVRGFRLALAICIRATPGAATWYVSYSCYASSSLRAFAHPYLNWSSVRVTARRRVRGLASTGADTLSVDTGSGSTPRNGPGSIATVAADRPRPARIWAMSPPVECPITAGLFSSAPITPAVWSATSP